MATQGEDVYATLLLNDSYLPGALVLAHSLRDAGTRKKLAVLVTTDNVSEDILAELRALFDYVIPVERVMNPAPGNLFLMGRPDLHSAFTKIALWRQTQFRRIVYMDADMVALRAPDELFDIQEPFSAAPDIGWPDLFNTGLLVLNPNMGDYYALSAMAQRGISFDGADQGLLNMHFKNSYNRLSFTYNVTPSAHYQYVPAYRHFQSGISAVHFIGQEKPWKQGRDASKGSGPYDEMLGRWWAVYDRHYRGSSSSMRGNESSSTVQHYVTGESKPPTGEGYSNREIPTIDESVSQVPYIAVEAPMESEKPVPETADVEQDIEAKEPPEQTAEKSNHDGGGDFVPPFAAWDPARGPPPADSKPEASNYRGAHYEMSSDRTPFRAPGRYPEPPTGMYYELPKTPTYQKPPPIFPWEKDAPKPTRVFAEDDDPGRPISSGSTIPDEKDEPATPTAHAAAPVPAESWQSFTTRGNAWDDIPEIERYIGALQKNRKGNIQVLQGYGSGIPQTSSPGMRRPSVKLTDFPTELERPSLPVTPAPVRRPSFWGEERDEQGELPAAEGVPTQEAWDPAAQLDILAQQQSEVLANRLGTDESGREMPTRPLPYGSEGVKSPTYVVPVPPNHNVYSPATQTKIEEPSFKGPGAMWEKGETFPISEPPLSASEEEKDALEN